MSQLNSNARRDLAARNRSARSRVLIGSLYVVAAVLTQAILAGLFISATAEARLAHLIVGSLLPWFALIPAVSAFRGRRNLDQRVVTGAILLPVALWVQEALGHMPFAVSTAVHVPLGVVIFGGSGVLALAAGRTARSRSASPPGAASGG